MSRPGDRPRWSREIPKGADPEERKRLEQEAQVQAKIERELEIERSRAADRADRRRRGAKLSPDEEAFDAGHELRDMRTRTVVRWLGLLTIGALVLIAGITLFEGALTGGIGPLRMVIYEPPQVAQPPAPRLERTNGEVLAAQRAKEDKVLNNYTWVDQGAGTVSLPIDRAIELTLQRGLPVRPQTSGQPSTTSTLPQGSSSGRTMETIP